MTLMKRASKVLFTVAATGAVVSMAAGTALAATHLTVKVTGGGSFTAKSTKTVLTDNGVSVTCTGSSGSGTIASKTDSGNSPVKVGTITKLSFSNCSGPLGKVTTKVMGLPYTMSVDSKTTSKGSTDGIISGAKVAVSMTGCSFMVTGSTPGFYTNSSHKLTVTAKLPTKGLNSAKLSVSKVSGCAGLVKNGDHPSYTSTYTVSRKIVIKSS
jgi:hypothetical protein